MRILITGICGFAGSVIAGSLLERREGVSIAGIDNLMRAGSEGNRLRLRKLGVTVAHGDVRMAGDVAALPDADWVIDAAAAPSVLAGLGNGISSRQLFEHNLAGVANMLEYCRERGAGLALISSSRVYSIAALAGLPLKDCGDAYALDASAAGLASASPKVIGQAEASSLPAIGASAIGHEPEIPSSAAPKVGQALPPVQAPGRAEACVTTLPPGLSPRGIGVNFPTTPPISLYGATKLAAETIALEWGAAFGFPVWIDRCGVLAGAGQFGTPDQGIFSYWINAHLRKRPLRYIGFGGSGKQVRDAMHPRDLAALLDAQMRAGRAGGDRIYTAGGGPENAMSLAQLTAWCDARFGPHAPAADPRERPFDVPWIAMDSSLAERDFAWRVETPLCALLEELAAHAEQHPGWLERSGA